MFEHGAVSAFHLSVLKVSVSGDAVDSSSAKTEIQRENRLDESLGAIAAENAEGAVATPQPVDAFRYARGVCKLQGKEFDRSRKRAQAREYFASSRYVRAGHLQHVDADLSERALSNETRGLPR